MSTPVLNAQLFQPPGAAAGIGGAAAGGQGVAGAVAGFEAMVAALFGQAQPTEGGPLAAPPFQALVQASAPVTGTVDPAATTDAQGGATDKDTSGEGGAKTDGQAATPDAALALMAGAALPATPQVVIPTAASAAADTGTATDGSAKSAALPTPQIFDPAAAACAAEAKAMPLAADPTAKAAPAAPGKDEAKPFFAEAAAPEAPTPAASAKTAAKADATPTTPSTDTPATPATTVAKTETAPAPPASDTPPPEAAPTATQTASLAQPAPAQPPVRGEPLPSNHRGGRDKPAGKSEVAGLGGPKAAAHVGPHAKPQAALSEAPIVEAAAAAATAAQDEDAGAEPADDRSSGAAGADQTQQTPTAQTPASMAAQQAAVRGSPQTVANFAAQMIKKLEAKTTRFDVQLDPAGLGKVDVRVEIGAEGRITAALACHNPQAAKELQARSGELQKALEQAGFDITGGLSFEMAGGGNGQPGAGQNPFAGQNDSGPAFHGRAFARALGTADDAAQAAAEGALRFRHSRPAGVDIRI